MSFATNETLINGIFFGGSVLSPSLDIVSLTNITLGGILDQWHSVSLSSQGISLLAGSSVSVLNSTGATGGATGSSPASGSINLTAGNSTFSYNQNITACKNLIISKDSPLVYGGTITLEPVPIPATLLLFAPGLAVTA